MQKSWRIQNIEASRHIGEGRAEFPKEGDLVALDKAALTSLVEHFPIRKPEILQPERTGSHDRSRTTTESLQGSGWHRVWLSLPVQHRCGFSFNWGADSTCFRLPAWSRFDRDCVCSPCSVKRIFYQEKAFLLRSLRIACRMMFLIG
jgi:hypothetical protein